MVTINAKGLFTHINIIKKKTLCIFFFSSIWHGGQPHWKIMKRLRRSCAEVTQILCLNHMSAGRMKLKLKELKYCNLLEQTFIHSIQVILKNKTNVKFFKNNFYKKIL